MIVPREPHTNVGDSEHPGGMKTYCSPDGRYSSQQGQLPNDWWSNVAFKTGKGTNGQRYAQRESPLRVYDMPSRWLTAFVLPVTGCIRPSHLTRLNPGDEGGQYDSSGGAGGKGNPQGSQCLGYKHYVELLEPAANRACIKCCDDPADCPTNKGTQSRPRFFRFRLIAVVVDTQGCPAVIKGNYFNCD